MRLIGLKMENVAWLALPLAFGLAHCSGTAGDNGVGNADISGSNDDSSGDDDDSTSTPTATGTGSKKDAGAAKGGTTKTDAGGGSNGTGTSPGTGTTPPAADAGTPGTTSTETLAPPPAGTGVQITSGVISVPPGAEIFKCKMIVMPSSAGAVKVGSFVSRMSTGSHHMILNVASSSEATHAEGDLWDCPASGGQWVYASSSTENHLDMPPDVGLPFDAGEKLTLNMHYVNPSSKAINVQVWINIGFAKNVKYDAGAMVSYNTFMSIPPQSKKTFGSQCSIAVGSKMFAISTHTHKNATSTTVDYVSGGTHTQLVNTTDWEHPDSKTWTAPNFLVTKQGDYFEEKCNYDNQTGGTITTGETAASNEMCMQIGYYYPAPAGQKTGLGATNCSYQ